MEPRRCDRCGFDPDDYTERDRATADRWLTGMAAHTVAPVPASVLSAEPQATTLGDLRSTVAALGGGAADVTHIHRAIHLLRDLGRQLHDAGAGTPSQRGTVTQISTSDGGVPKSAIDAVEVGLGGVLGDRQGDRTHHGRPFQALCLWSAEVIDALRAEGHPVGPGAAGENLTLAGIDWATMRPGVRLLVGQVLCEISAWATPCRKNDRWFTGRSDRIDHELHPGWSRAYAWVLEPGAITTGDEVLVEP